MKLRTSTFTLALTAATAFLIGGCDAIAGTSVFEYDEVDVKPTPVSGWSQLTANVEYPEMAKRAGIEGVAVVDLIVSRDGAPYDLRITMPVGGGCDESAIAAVRDEAFDPGREDGDAVDVAMRIAVTFSLADTTVTAALHSGI